jgi:hypothetical protein
MKRLIVVVVAGMVGMAITCGAQNIVIEPDSLDFGDIAIGANGRPEGNRELTVSNLGDSEAVLIVQFQLGLNRGRCELVSPQVAAAREAIRAINDAAGYFRQCRRQDPWRGLEQLLEEGYLQLDSTVSQQWTFELIGLNPITQIGAVSTDQMPDGAGHYMLFDISVCEFVYYGALEEVTLAAGESRSFVTSYMPDSTGEVRGWLDLFQGGGQGGANCSLQANGIVPRYLRPSSDSLDFGLVRLDERGRRELRLVNTSGLFIDCEFEFSDPNHFCINNQFIEYLQEAMLDIVRGIELYRYNHGNDPSSVEQLEEEGYVNLSEQVNQEWGFSFIGARPITDIEAVSTGYYPRGAGEVVFYELSTRQFKFHGDRGGTFLGVNREDTYFVTFLPDTTALMEGELLIRAHTENEYLEPQALAIKLKGEGTLSAPPSSLIPYPSSLLLSAYPNPFNDRVSISVNLPKPGVVTMEVYDPLGRRVMDLIPGSWLVAGEHSVNWDAAGMPTGGYLIRAKSGGGEMSREVVKVK